MRAPLQPRVLRSARRPPRGGVEHLRAAFELEPETVRGWAAKDSDLDSLRDDPAFPA